MASYIGTVPIIAGDKALGISFLGSYQAHAFNENHLRLLETYRDTLRAHHLVPPPGYGEPGPGNAVFSVSPFMDVLEPEEVAPQA